MKSNMKRVILSISCIILIVFAFHAGKQVSKQEYEESKRYQCSEYVASAIKIIENKGISESGVRENVISYVFAAHELCDIPDLSAKLNDLQLSLTHQTETIENQDLIQSLDAILNSLLSSE